MRFLDVLKRPLVLSTLIALTTFRVAGAQMFPAVAKLPARPELPDPFTMFDGSKVRTRKQWHDERRPELMALFQHYMYGHTPAPPGIVARLGKTDSTLFEGKATLKEIEISFRGLSSDNAPRIHLALFIPADGGGPFPVFLALNKCGNHTVVDHPGITIDPSAWVHEQCGGRGTAEGRGAAADFWCIDYLISRGYAFATFHESNIDPDKHDFSDGIHPHYPDLPGPKESRWGTIAAWAWGLQRCVDYLVTDAQIDPDRIAVTGHSRRGKTALLAGAFDERIALVVPHQSGTGGCALSRDNDQETVERINRVFPHWFNDTFTQFNDNEARLPIDQHLLMALVAPRPLLDTEGKQDKWANYNSARRAMQAADKVYKFLGSDGLVGTGLVEDDEPIDGPNFGTLLQYRRDTRHTLNRGYWKAILDFADLHLGR